MKKILILGRDLNTSENKGKVFSEELQSCMAALEEGLEVVLLSNTTNLDNQLKVVLDIPIYKMTLTRESVVQVMDIELPDLVYSPFWGSSGWKLFRELEKEEYWKKNGIRAVGLGNDYSLQSKRKVLKKAGVKHKRAYEVNTLQEAEKRMKELGGLPLFLRTEQHDYIYFESKEKLRSRVLVELGKSVKGNIILEETIADSKEIEVGILRDTNGFANVACTSENILPARFESGRAMSVSPIQSLNENQTKAVTDSALKVANKLVDFAGYCTIQLIQTPEKRILVSDIKFKHPKSAAVVSLALGCSLLNANTKLALGRSLNDIMRSQRIKKRHQEKVIFSIPGNSQYRNSCPGYSGNKQRIYVGQNFCETLVKAFEDNIKREQKSPKTTRIDCIKKQNGNDSDLHLDVILKAFGDGMPIEEIALLVNVDTWFLNEINRICELQHNLRQKQLESIKKEEFSLLKAYGFSDGYIASLMSSKDRKVTEQEVNQRRRLMDISSVTLHHFERCRNKGSQKRKILILPGSRVEGKPLQVPAVVLVQEAHRMGYEVMLMTKDVNTISFWMAFVDRIYIDSPNKENLRNIKNFETPSAVFIDGDDLLPGYLEKYFAEIGITTVKVPFKLPDQLSNTNGTQ